MKKITDKTTIGEVRKIVKDIERKCNPLTKEDYKFIDFYCKAHLIPKGKGYENTLVLFLQEYKLNKR